MFDIEYRGGNAIVITTKKSALVVDPKRTHLGLKNIVEKDGVELATEVGFLTGADEYKISLEGPGEYEASGFAIKGIPAHRHLDDPKTTQPVANIYSITVGGIKMAIVGNIAPEVTETHLDELGVVDILIIPVGGSGYTLDSTAAANITRKIDPKIVIPVHHAEVGITYEVPQNSIDTFISELKAPVVEAKKLKIKSEANLPTTLEVHKLTFIK